MKRNKRIGMQNKGLEWVEGGDRKEGKRSKWERGQLRPEIQRSYPYLY